MTKATPGKVGTGFPSGGATTKEVQVVNFGCRLNLYEGEAIKARAAGLRQTIAAARSEWLRAQIGRPLSVLAEADGTGHAENFARVRLPAGVARGEIVTVIPNSIEEGLLA